MLVIELDGGQHLEQQDDDQARTRHLQAKGYRVLRFWNNDVLTNIESVLEVLIKALASPGPSPQRSPPFLIRDGEREPRARHALPE
jgi:very-short-patch-repair endonuclease